jgi:hypothetical protein
MKRSIAIAALTLAVILPSAGWAGDMEGKVQAVNAAERTITLDNGTTVWLAESVALDGVKEGAEVKMVYEEKDGKPVASSVEVK